MAVTDFAALAFSASLSLSFFACLSLVPCTLPYSYSLVTALSAVTASQDLILTLLPQCFSLFLHPYTLSPSFLGPRLRFLSSYRIQSSPCLSATLQRSSYWAWKSCSTHHLQVRIVFNESYKPKAENWHSHKFTHTHIHQYAWLPDLTYTNACVFRCSLVKTHKGFTNIYHFILLYILNTISLQVLPNCCNYSYIALYRLSLLSENSPKWLQTEKYFEFSKNIMGVRV